MPTNGPHFITEQFYGPPPPPFRNPVSAPVMGLYSSIKTREKNRTRKYVDSEVVNYTSTIPTTFSFFHRRLPICTVSFIDHHTMYCTFFLAAPATCIECMTTSCENAKLATVKAQVALFVANGDLVHY